MLTHVPARFNPVAALYTNRRKAFEMAANGDGEYVFNEYVSMKYYQAPGSPAWKKVSPFPGPAMRP